MKRMRHGVAGVFAVLIGLCISTPVVAMDLGAAREAVAQTVVTTARGAVERVIPSATSPMRAQQQQQQQQSSTRIRGRSVKNLVKLGVAVVVGIFVGLKWLFGRRAEA